MTYPYEAGEAERFVPAAFAGAKNPPTFWLRWATPREKRAFRRLMELEGLRKHSLEAQREELLRAMKERLTAEEFAIWQPRAKEYWDSSDQFRTELNEFRKENPDAKPDEWPTFDLDGAGDVEMVLDQLGRDWEPFRRMMADNDETQHVSPDLINAVVITSFENLPIPLRTEGRTLSYLCAAAIPEALREAAKAIDVPEGTPNPAAELYFEAMRRYTLDRSAEKNSPSPPPSSSTPRGSKTGKGSTAGKSKGSATSKKTPEA